ncbi:hypothetical protein [Mycoplasmopsis lipofaciens]|uniref:hypothetical protein n=1 Tax=Mycoplasmopsis lipofaciens TaxID=114884 RepID=UPI0004871899|nr:hypothetical protein [Mycoplasmopsis lipofaciens]
MTNLQNTNTITALPVLKPIILTPNFVQKIKGECIKSDVMMLIAEDEEYVFFVSCLKEFDEKCSNSDVIKINTTEGVSEKGDTENITIAKAIDLSIIYKMDYFELKKKLQNENNEVEKLPYLGIKNQLEVVNKITEKLSSTDDLPKLVIIKKSKQKNKNKK